MIISEIIIKNKRNHKKKLNNLNEKKLNISKKTLIFKNHN